MLATPTLQVVQFLRAGQGRFKRVWGNYGVIVLDFGGETAPVEVNWFTAAQGADAGGHRSDSTANEGLVFQSGAGPKVRRTRKGDLLALQVQNFLCGVRTDAALLVSGREGLRDSAGGPAGGAEDGACTKSDRVQT
jgi:hypothetical protein